MIIYSDYRDKISKDIPADNGFEFTFLLDIESSSEIFACFMHPYNFRESSLIEIYKVFVRGFRSICRRIVSCKEKKIENANNYYINFSP